MRLSRSSSWSFSEMPRTGPREMRFIRCVVKPEILFLRRFDGIIAATLMTCRSGGKRWA